ncbi:MAG: hypothetical protein Q9181_002742 [Wetmoreana brouardii]
MSLSVSYADIHALAERARAKFGEQVDAKDQRLPLILAHARLYDDLDHHLETLRLKRKSSERPQHIRDTAQPNQQDAPRTEQTVPQDSNGHAAEKANGSWAKWDLVADCAIFEEDGVDPPPKYDDTMASGSVQLLGSSDDHSTSHHSHKVHADAPPQTTVSELPIDSDDESESDSDTDSDSDSDSESCPDENFECDRTLSPEGKTAIPVSISRPISPHHRHQRDSEPQLPPKPSTPSMQGPPQVDDELPTLERSAPTSQPPSSPPPPTQDTAADEIGNNHTAQQSTASHKASPLSPQLCDDTDSCTDLSSAIYEDFRVQKALRQLLKPCRAKDAKEKLAYQQAILGTLSSLAFWGRRRKGVEILGAEIEDEKIVS